MRLIKNDAELCARIGYDHGNWSKILGGDPKRKITPGLRLKLQEFGIRQEYLSGKDGEIFTEDSLNKKNTPPPVVVAGVESLQSKLEMLENEVRLLKLLVDAKDETIKSKEDAIFALKHALKISDSE